MLCKATVSHDVLELLSGFFTIVSAGLLTRRDDHANMLSNFAAVKLFNKTLYFNSMSVSSKILSSHSSSAAFTTMELFTDCRCMNDLSGFSVKNFKKMKFKNTSLYERFLS